MTKSPPLSPSAATWSASGEKDSSWNDCRAWRSAHARAGPRFFPPEIVVQVKAIACELPATLGLPLSRLSTADIVGHVRSRGIAATISDKTV
jgi:hypothetical protein